MQPEPIEGPSTRAATVYVPIPFEKYPPQLPPDPYDRQPVSNSDLLPSQRAPVTDPYADWYAEQLRATVGSSSSNHNSAAQMVSPAETPFVASAVAVDNNNDEVAVVCRFLEDAGFILSDELMMTRTEMLYFVKDPMWVTLAQVRTYIS